jgi:hypothetical protein
MPVTSKIFCLSVGLALVKANVGMQLNYMGKGGAIRAPPALAMTLATERHSPAHQ